MNTIEVLDQAQLDSVPDDFAGIIVVKGTISIIKNRNATYSVFEGSPSIVARESSSPSIVARESAMIAGNSGAYAITSGHFDSGAKIKITGPHVVLLQNPVITTAEDWCAYHGATVKDGVAILYKGVSDEYRSGLGFAYPPGTTPEAPDWDRGKAECGGGLHFCAHPAATLSYNKDTTKFIACPVALSDMRAPKANDTYPDKIKAARTCGPIYEVDRFGEPVKGEPRV